LTGTERQYFTNIIGLSSTTVTYSACKAIEFGDKMQNRAITPFKVIQGHRVMRPVESPMRRPISD